MGDIKKFIPLFVIVFAILALAGIWLSYEKGLQPDVLAAKGSLAESNAVLAESEALRWKAIVPALQAMPQVMLSAAYVPLAIFLGAGVGALILSFAMVIGGMAVTKVVSSGIGYSKITPSGETTVYLAPPDTVVGARLERLAQRASNAIPIRVGEGGSERLPDYVGPSRDGNKPGTTAKSRRGSGNTEARRKTGSTPVAIPVDGNDEESYTDGKILSGINGEFF